MVALFVCFLRSEFDAVPAFAIAFIVLLIFGLAALLILNCAIKKGESQPLGGKIVSIEPVRGWVSAQIGSYLVSMLGITFDFQTCCVLIGLAICLSLIVQLCNDIPPPFFALLFGYRFCTVGLKSGVSGYCLITKRKVIRDPRVITSVVYFSKNEYWLIEKVG